jgi:hypothetical protein
MRGLQNDYSEIGYATVIEVSDAVKEWIAEHDAERPFGISWPAHRKLESELKYFGFTDITISKLEPHAVYVVRGRSGNSACSSSADLRRIFKTLGRAIGFQFQAADTALSFSRGRFEVVLCLPDGSVATEILPDNCQDHHAENI